MKTLSKLFYTIFLATFLVACDKKEDEEVNVSMLQDNIISGIIEETNMSKVKVSIFNLYTSKTFIVGESDIINGTFSITLDVPPQEALLILALAAEREGVKISNPNARIAEINLHAMDNNNRSYRIEKGKETDNIKQREMYFYADSNVSITDTSTNEITVRPSNGSAESYTEKYVEIQSTNLNLKKGWNVAVFSKRTVVKDDAVYHYREYQTAALIDGVWEVLEY